jgi:hypothetical protein
MLLNFKLLSSMKKISIVLLFIFSSAAVFAQAPFGFSEKHGFGMPLPPNIPNKHMTGSLEFKNRLYIGVGNDSGYVYRSSTGDPGSFEKVYESWSVRKTEHFAATADGSQGGYLFMGADISSTYGTPKVERTADGVTWLKYFQLPSGSYYFTGINTYKGVGAVDSVYVSYFDNNNNTQMVLRNGVDAMDPSTFGGTWDTVMNFSLQAGITSRIAASTIYNGKLYYAMDDNRLFETADGRSLSYNTDFASSMGIGSGLGNMNVSAMAEYNGELYFGTQNYDTGYEIWKTSDGISYTSLRDSIDLNFDAVVNMKAANGKLWILARDYFNNTFQLLSYDGSAFTLESNDEFGQLDLEINEYSTMGAFNDHLYVGVTHFLSAARLINPGNNQVNAFSGSTGGQLWRTCLTGAFPNVSITSTNPLTVCATTAINANITATGNAISYIWNPGGTAGTNMTATDTGHYYITGIASNGCRYAAEQIINSYPVPMAPEFNADTYIGISSTNVCLGDTSSVVFAYDPIGANPGLEVPGGDMGFTTPATNVFNSNRDITIELWFLPYAFTEGPIISEADTLSSGSSWGIISLIRRDISGNIKVHVKGNTTTEINLGNAAHNTWHHIVLRYNSATSTLDGFLDGVQGPSDTRTRDVPQDVGGTDCYKICMKSFVEETASAPYNANGVIRDIRIWNAALDNSDILDNMYGLPAGPPPPELIYHYKTNETSGNAIADHSLYGHDTLVAGVFQNPTPIVWAPDPTLIDLGNGYARMHPMVETTYKAYYIGANGCASDTGYFDAIVPYIEVTNAYDPGIFASCGGDLIYVEPYSNVGLNNPTWSSPSLGSITTYSTVVAPPSPEYVLVVDTVWGYCPLSDSVLITVGPAFESAVGNPLPIFDCEGAETVLDAQNTGGTAPYTYVWNNTFFDDTTSVDTLVYTIPSGYVEVYLNAYDAIGCHYMVSFSTSSTPSTDLYGHVTTQAPADVDNGFVYVFKHQPGSAGLDTMGFTSLDANGNYIFTPLTAGNYLIKVMPDETDFPYGVPTYYGNTFQWDSSTVYTHGCAQTDTANIQIVEIDTTTYGDATVSGYILEGDGFGATARIINNGGGQPNHPFVPGGPLKGIDVKLGKNPGGGIQARTMSDTTGFYEFDSIPPGGYKIYVDIPNLPMDSTRELIIAVEDSSIQNNYYADSSMIYIIDTTITPVGIYASAKTYENKFSIYPNPARGNLYLNYELSKSSEVSFELRNVMGQLIQSIPYHKYPEGKNIFVMNTEYMNLQSGVYFISILLENKKYTQRLVVID